MKKLIMIPHFLDNLDCFRITEVRAVKALRALYLALRYGALLPFLISRRTEVVKPEDIKKIVVLRYDRIGDMVLTTPLFEGLKRKFPSSFLIVVASEANKEIISNNPYVDRVEVYEGRRWFIEKFRKEKIDLAVDVFYTYELKQAFLTYLAGARYRIGFHNAGREVFFNLKGPREDTRRPMLKNIVVLGEMLGLDMKGISPKLYVSEKEALWAQEHLPANAQAPSVLNIAIHPGANYPSQRWEKEKFAEIAAWIKEKSLGRVILFGDRKEEGLIDYIRSRAGVDEADVFTCLGLRQFIALLGRCDLLICNNSGPLHIAMALTIPTLSMMGPTEPGLWQPRGDSHSVIYKGLACSPCSRGECTAHTCMELISVEEVREAVRKKISAIRGENGNDNSHG